MFSGGVSGETPPPKDRIIPPPLAVIHPLERGVLDARHWFPYYRLICKTSIGINVRSDPETYDTFELFIFKAGCFLPGALDSIAFLDAPARQCGVEDFQHGFHFMLEFATVSKEKVLSDGIL